MNENNSVERLRVVRDNIDAIDEQLLELMTERAQLAVSTLAFKSGQSEVFVPEREREVLRRLVALNTSQLSPAAIKSIFQVIIQECRLLQQRHVPIGDQALCISVQGAKGSFSEAAAQQFCRQSNWAQYQLDYAISPQAVIAALETGQAKYGVLAINNAWGGLVQDSVAVLARHRHRIVDIFPLYVEQCLLVAPDVTADRITMVASHPQALQQCRGYLQKHWPGIEQTEYIDTAQAAADLASGILPATTAVLASRLCAKQYDLSLLETGIQDLADNDTLFIVVKCHEPADEK